MWDARSPLHSLWDDPASAELTQHKKQECSYNTFLWQSSYTRLSCLALQWICQRHSLGMEAVYFLPQCAVHSWLESEFQLIARPFMRWVKLKQFFCLAQHGANRFQSALCDLIFVLSEEVLCYLIVRRTQTWYSRHHITSTTGNLMTFITFHQPEGL